MQISDRMSLGHLAELMGTAATAEDAANMRKLLVRHYDNNDTTDIPEKHWLKLVEAAARPAPKPLLPALLRRIAAQDEAGVTVLDMAHDMAELASHAALLAECVEAVQRIAANPNSVRFRDTVALAERINP